MAKTPNQALQQTAGHDSFLGLKLSGAPPLLSLSLNVHTPGP